MKALKVSDMGGLKVYVLNTRKELGEAAGKDAAEKIKKVIEKQGEANVVFAAAPSQKETLEALLASDVDWSKVRAFHMDEYIGLAPDSPARFGNFLKRAIFDKVGFNEVHYIPCEGDAQKICEDYSNLLTKYPPDVIMLGIGENGHLAFNDPPVADFNDPKKVKIVALDDICRKQQVNDGCFPTIDDVPKTAITLTMSMIMSAPYAITAVPSSSKADAIKATIHGPITTDCPASILREHKCATLYLDKDSAKKAFTL